MTAFTETPTTTQTVELPRKGDWPAYARLGVARLADVTHLICLAELPAGWTIGPATEPFWSHVSDQRGVPRIAVYHRESRMPGVGVADSHIVHVGNHYATQAMWAAHPTALPEVWPLLTAREREEFARSIARTIRECAARRGGYTGAALVHNDERADRARALLALATGVPA